MNFKNKLFGVALAASMITGAVVPAMAATITIENAQEGVPYSAYKIFDIDHSNGATGTYDGYAYTIENSNPWKVAVDNYLKKDGKAGELVLEQAAKDNNLWIVKLGQNFNPVEFGAHLEEHLKTVNSDEDETNDITPSVDTNDNNNVIEVAKAGYYLVHATNGTNSLAVLVNSTDTKVIVDKNKQGITKRFRDGSTEDFVAIGDTVYYTLSSVVPYRPHGADSNFSFRITDTMPNSFGLTENSFVVRIGGENTEPLTYGSDYTVSPVDNQNAFTLNIPINDNTNVGKDITITYNGVVTDAARQVVVTTENNPGHENKVEGTVNGQIIEDKVSYYTASYQIKKVAEDRETPLAGAVFTLSTNYDGVIKYYSVDANGAVSWVTKDQLGTLPEGITETSGGYHVTQTGGESTADDGVLTFVGLDADKVYTLTEVKAPSGYNLLKDAETISFKEDGQAEYQRGNGSRLLLADNAHSIVNNKGVQLPETGGMGTTLFYMVGGTLTAGAAVMLITKKRMSEAE